MTKLEKLPRPVHFATYLFQQKIMSLSSGCRFCNSCMQNSINLELFSYHVYLSHFSLLKGGGTCCSYAPVNVNTQRSSWVDTGLLKFNNFSCQSLHLLHLYIVIPSIPLPQGWKSLYFKGMNCSWVGCQIAIRIPWVTLGKVVGDSHWLMH